MNEDPPQPAGADRVPTLTEVLELQAAPAAETPAEPTPTAAPPAIDTQALVAEVLGELQPRLDMLFESRLREALAPALARAAEALIRDARTELGTALHDLVDDAVKRALQRRGLPR